MRFVAQAVAIGVLAVCGLGYGQNSSRAEVVAFLPEDGPIRFTQDGRRLVTLYRINEGGRQTVQAYRLESNVLVLEDYLRLPRLSYLLAVDGAGQRLVVSAESRCDLAEAWPNTHFSRDSRGRLEVLEFPKGKRILRLEAQSLCGLTYPVFSPNGRLLAVPNRGGYVQLWDLQTGQLKHTFSGLGRIETITFSPDGSRLAICEQGVAVYTVSSRKPITKLESSCTGIYPAFTSDNSRLLVADGMNPVGIWDLRSGRLERTLPLRDGHVANALALSQDGTRIITLDVGRGLSLYDYQSGRTLYQTAKGGVALVASPSLEWFATAAPPQLWRLR